MDCGGDRVVWGVLQTLLEAVKSTHILRDFAFTDHKHEKSLE